MWLYGIANNYLPYILPSLVAKRATKEVEFVAPIMLTVGMITFPLAYALQAVVVQHWLHNGWLTALYLVSLPLTGFYALGYYTQLAERLLRLRARRLFRQQPAVGQQLLAQRAAIVQALEVARKAFEKRN